MVCVWGTMTMDIGEIENKINKPIAFAFWWFGGLFGFHRFYLGKHVSGAVQAALPFFTALACTYLFMSDHIALSIVLWGFLAAVIIIWWVIDGIILMRALRKIKDDVVRGALEKVGAR